MFKDCTALTSVTFAKSTSMIGNGAFTGCTSLETLQMPQDISFIPDDFASGCYQLRDVSFSGAGNLSQAGSIRNRIFSGTAITSLTLPTSVNSLNSFSDNTLKGMSNLQELHLNGISYNDIVESELPYEDKEDETPQEE